MSLPRRRPNSRAEEDLLEEWGTISEHPKPRRRQSRKKKDKDQVRRTDDTDSKTIHVQRESNHKNKDTPPKDKPYTYHGYHGDGYPKGFVDDDGFPIGPTVLRYDRTTKKYIKVTGIAYEDLPRSYQRILDKRPYDDAGQLRIFRKPAPDPKHPEKPLLSGGNIFLEYGSYEQAQKLFKSMKTMEDSIYNGENIGYSARPALDDLHVYTRSNSKEDGFDESNTELENES